MQITDNQILHRQYLESPIWKSKRLEAIGHCGTICGRCGRYGTDVHHRNYERVGGGELMEDLEVLCRSCHEAHHVAERCVRRPGQPKRKSIRQDALFRLLTTTQRNKICAMYRIEPTALYLALSFGPLGNATHEAARMLGFGGAYKPFRREARSKIPPLGGNRPEIKIYLGKKSLGKPAATADQVARFQPDPNPK